MGFKPPIVLDPCLQFTAQAEERDSKYWQKPYIAVYGHNFSASFISKVKAWSAHRELPLISIGYRNDWADEQWLTADPHDFAHFIHKAEAVITNFFHGCVFSIRNAKPFVCEASPYRSNKINDLLEMTGGTMRLVNDTTPATVFNHCLNTCVEQDMQQRVQVLRHLSDNYLDHALKIKQPNRYESFA